VADNDASGTGQKYADQASAKYGARVVMPPELGDANDYAQAGNDLRSLLMPQPDDWLVTADSLCSQPAPISWLVKRWLQEQALIMVHGPSGVGKTFVLMDMCLRMASGMPDWAGHRVKPGSVVYLAGEGHYGLRGRIAAWKHKHQAGSIQMWVSRHGCDLNTAQGFQKAADAVRALPQRPSLIVVDTLHRFLAGDENSAQDAKTMIDACDRLKIEFGCSVLLVHHTGVSEEAQHRGRGSSAWKGALDIELSITGGKKGQPLKIEPKKVKDGEEPDPVYCDLESVSIPGWVDEDGEPVSSAVPLFVSAPPAPSKATKASQAEHELKMQFKRAWYDTGAEVSDGLPYVSRAGLKMFLQKNRIKDVDGSEIDGPGKSDDTAKRYVQNDGHAVARLLDLNWIKKHDYGWVVIDPEEAQAMLINRK
jgi:putative DNA primase/helicase